MNGDQQQTQFFTARGEVIKGIDNKPMTPKEGMPPSFRWIVYTESNRRYSFFAPTADRNQTFLKGLDAPHTVDITYFITPGINPVTKQPTTYNNIAAIERVMQAGDTAPAMDAAITQQEQTTMPPQEQQAIAAGVSPVAYTPPPQPVIGSETAHPATVEPLPVEPELMDFPAVSGTPATEPQTMMVHPVARAIVAAELIRIHYEAGFMKAKLTKAEKELEDQIMAKVYGIITAMDSLPAF